MNTPHRQNNFDIIRLFAAIQVVFIHTRSWLDIPIKSYVYHMMSMFSGVAIFFIISGFLITKSFVESGGNLKRYTMNRVLRIYPGLWVNFLFIIVLLYATGAIKDIFAINFGLWGLCQSLTGLSMFGQRLFDWAGFYHFFPSGVTWTIAVELGFYGLVPWFFLPFINERKKLFNIIFVLVFIASISFSLLNGRLIASQPSNKLALFLQWSILPYLWIFMIGSLVYLKWSCIHMYIKNKFIYWLALHVLISLLAFSLHGSMGIDFKTMGLFNVIRVLVLAGCVISFAYSFKSLNFLNGKIDLSYGVYLYHMQVVCTLMSLGLLHSQYLWILVFASTFALAALSWFLVEKPALTLKYKVKFGNDIRESISPA
ncbi:MAG: acyltransferase [Gammaproteobacteria bacterium]|nr:acyltransferase [Gammaproteobacteria bacterium]